MNSEDYNHLFNIQWRRIMESALLKYNIEPLEKAFQEYDGEIAYNVVRQIIDSLSQEKGREISMLITFNTLLQIGIMANKEQLLYVVDQIEMLNQDEIMAVQALMECIENQDSWQTINDTIAIILSPEFE